MTLSMGIILYENFNNKLYLGGGHQISYNLWIIKHYKEMSLIFLTLPNNWTGGIYEKIIINFNHYIYGI